MTEADLIAIAKTCRQSTPLAEFLDLVRDRFPGAELAADRAAAILADHGAPWTLSEVREANLSAGRHFFDRATMRAFGDTMKSFRLAKEKLPDGRLILVRVRPMRDRSGRDMGGIGQRRPFDPRTGEIGPPLA